MGGEYDTLFSVQRKPQRAPPEEYADTNERTVDTATKQYVANFRDIWEAFGFGSSPQ